MKISQLIRRLFSYQSDKAIACLNAQYMTIGVGSVLQQHKCLDFRVKPEDRKYVTIGKQSIIKASFVFESTRGLVRIGNNTQLGGGTSHMQKWNNYWQRCDHGLGNYAL